MELLGVVVEVVVLAVFDRLADYSVGEQHHHLVALVQNLRQQMAQQRLAIVKRIHQLHYGELSLMVSA